MLRNILRILKRLYTYKFSIHFIYADQYRDYGSTILRGKQLFQIAQKVLSPTNKVYYTSTDYNYKNCTLFLTKWSIFSLSLKDLEQLKANGNLLIFDPVDSILPTEKLKYAGIVVAVSETIYKLYKKRFPSFKKIVVVNHNVDLRLKNVDWSKRSKKFKAGYFGEAITEQKILGMLKYAKKSFGSKTWMKGLETMHKIRLKTSEEAIGKELVELFTEAGIKT